MAIPAADSLADREPSFDAQRIVASVPVDRLKASCAEGRDAVHKLVRTTFSDLNRGNRNKLQESAAPEAHRYFLTKGCKATN